MTYPIARRAPRPRRTPSRDHRVCLGALDGEPPLLGHLGPQISVDAIGSVAAPREPCRALHVSRAGPPLRSQSFLVVGEVEVHRARAYRALAESSYDSSEPDACVMLRRTRMDLTATPQQEDLRAELRSWLAANLPWEYGTGLPPHFDDLAEEVAFLRSWQAQPRQRPDGSGVTWPVAYGGRGLGPAANFVVQEELARARAPELVGRIGVNLAGPTLLEHGTEDQKLKFLPPILRAEELWCQLFSEPDAGSDLASVRTRAAAAERGIRP